MHSNMSAICAPLRVSLSSRPDPWLPPVPSALHYSAYIYSDVKGGPTARHCPVGISCCRGARRHSQVFGTEVPQRQKLQAPGPHPPARSPRAGGRVRQGFHRCGQATGSWLPLAGGQPASRSVVVVVSGWAEGGMWRSWEGKCPWGFIQRPWAQMLP